MRFATIEKAAGICAFIALANLVFGTLFLAGSFDGMLRASAPTTAVGIGLLLEGLIYAGLAVGVARENRAAVVTAAVVYGGSTFLYGAAMGGGISLGVRAVILCVLGFAVIEVFELKELDKKADEMRAAIERDKAEREQRRQGEGWGRVAKRNGSRKHRKLSHSSAELQALRNGGGGSIRFGRDKGGTKKFSHVSPKALCPMCHYSYPLHVSECRVCKVELYSNL